jgi:lipopolysaccharide cholinephosphotransferase
MMLREDYDRLLAHADAFEAPYLLQSLETDEGYLRGHAQLRNTRTTCIVRSELALKLPYNQGIFIDIFPLDAAAPNEKLLQKQKKRLASLMTQAWDSYFSGPGYHEDTAWKKNRLLHPVMPVLGKVWDYKKIMRAYFKEAQRFNDRNTRYVAKVAYACGDRRMYDLREGFETFTMAPFEMLEVPLYGDYENHLKRQYGDYMKFVIGTADHGGLIFDPDLPADEWLKEHQDQVKEAVDKLHGRA